MKTIRQKRIRQSTAPQINEALSQQLEVIQRALDEINVGLRLPQRPPPKQSARRPSTDETRYLSEPELANYQLASARLTGPEDSIAFCERHFRLLIDQALQEELHAVTLNVNNRVIRSHQVTVGLLNSTQVHPREVFRPAIIDSASTIILLHNHPSGNCEPSKEDLKVTTDIEAAAKTVGIPLLDHIIVARDRSISIFQWRDERRPLIG